MNEIGYWGTLHSNIFLDYVKSLEENNIRYFIFRNFEGLPEVNIGKDVDIIIENHSYKRAFHILTRVLSKYDIHNLTINKFDQMRCFYVMDINKEFAIHIDIIENYYYKGFEFFSFKELYIHAKKYKGFYVLAEPINSVMLLLQNVLAYNSLKSKYQDIIFSNFVKNKEAFSVILIDFLGRESGLKVLNYLKVKDFESIVIESKSLWSVARNRIFIKKPFYTISNILRFLSGKTYRVLICPKKFQRFICVLGPDGAGKTTFINSLVKSLSYYYVSETNRFKIYHHRPSILPNLGAAGEQAGVMKEDKDFTNPHRAKPSGFISSFIRMTYYWLDYFFGTPLIIRKDAQYGNYTIFDRYIYDFIVDPHRSRINLPYWMRKLFSKLVIQPQIVFVLSTDKETIFKRKQELTLNEIERQLGEFSKLSRSHKRFIVIDASKSPEEMVEDALKVIINNFTEKV